MSPKLRVWIGNELGVFDDHIVITVKVPPQPNPFEKGVGHASQREQWSPVAEGSGHPN